MALQLDNLNALHPYRAYKNQRKAEKMVKDKKLMRALIVGASIFALAGCGAPNDTDTNGEKETQNTYIENEITNTDKKDNSDEINSNDVGSMDGDEIIAASDLQGHVIEFSENGCVVNPVTSDNAAEAVAAADGYEDEGEKVTIQYGEGCIFQRAVMSIATGKATVSEVAKEDIKKKTSLLLYGDFDGTENFTAAKVVIVQYE